MNFPQLCGPKKVLMTADTIGGVWTYAMELARLLNEHGVSVFLATMGARLTPAQRHELQQLPNTEVFESAYKLEWMEKPWFDLARANQWLLHLAEQVRPDIVHLNSYIPAALPFSMPKLVVGHSCVLSWWEAVKGESAPSTWNWYRYRVTKALQAADLVIAPSRAMLAGLQRHYGPLRLAEVIPNGRDPEAFTPLAKEPFVLIAGRLWDEAKNLNALARVAPTLPWPIYVAGDTHHPDGGQAQAEQVRTLGKLSPAALAAWFGRAAIYALPARYEPFGLSALEAALSGCALVLGDIASLREIWDGAALFVTPSDPNALKAALLKLIADSELRSVLSHQARARAIEFTSARMVTGYLSACAELMMTETQPRFVLQGAVA